MSQTMQRAMATPAKSSLRDEDATGELMYGEIVVIDRNGDEGDRLPFYGKALIGRTDDCDIRIGLPYVSRKHAFICLDENGNISMQNLTKKNMTMVNSSVVDDETVLKSGDVITIADRRFKWVSSQHFSQNINQVVSVKSKQSKQLKTPNSRSALKEKNQNQNRGEARTIEEMSEKANEVSKMVDDIFGALKSTPGKTKSASKAKAKNSRALPTPIRKALVNQKNKSENEENESPSSALPTPIRKSGQDQEQQSKKSNNNQAKTQDQKSRAGESKKTALATPMREAIEARETSKQQDIFSKKKSALSTPIREEIRNAKPVEKPEVKKVLATPLRKDIEEERFTGLPASAAKFFKSRKSGAAATPLDLNKLADDDDDLESSAAGSMHSDDHEDDDELLDDDDFEDEDEDELVNFAASPSRADIEAQLKACGYNVDKYADWSIDELTQRLRSATLQDELMTTQEEQETGYEGDYVENYDEEEEEELDEEEACRTPKQQTRFEGTHKVFDTPSDTPHSAATSVAVHWTYSDYERDGDESDGASTVSHGDDQEEMLDSECEGDNNDEVDDVVSLKVTTPVKANDEEVDDEGEEEEEHLQESHIEAEVSEAEDTDVMAALANQLENTVIEGEVQEEEDACQKVEASFQAPSPLTKDPSAFEKMQERALEIEDDEESAAMESASEDDEDVSADEEPRAAAPPARRKSMRIAEASVKKAPEPSEHNANHGEEEEELLGAGEAEEVEEESEEFTALRTQCNGFKVAELRTMLKDADLETKGLKAELVERLAKFLVGLPEEQRSLILNGATSEDVSEDAVAEAPGSPRRGIMIPSLLKVTELKAELTQRGIPAKGLKAELAELLQKAIIAEEQQVVETSDDGETFLKEGHELLFEPVARDLDGVLCPAVVVGFLPATEEEPEEMFRVRFLDGDVEDVDIEELKAAREAFKSL